MLLFIKGNEKHVTRLHDIFDAMPKGWKKKVEDALKNTGLELPVPRQ
jgi:hypothetical protein